MKRESFSPMSPLSSGNQSTNFESENKSTLKHFTLKLSSKTQNSPSSYKLLIQAIN